MKVKTEVIEGTMIYPSQFVSVNPHWFERVQFDAMTVPEAWAQEQYTYELWNKENRPIWAADRLRASTIPLEVLNQKISRNFDLSCLFQRDRGSSDHGRATRCHHYSVQPIPGSSTFAVGRRDVCRFGCTSLYFLA